jgi:hypothetical protein
MDAYKLLFTEKGLVGLDIPPHGDAEILARRFSFIRALRPAIDEFEKQIQQIQASEGNQ